MSETNRDHLRRNIAISAVVLLALVGYYHAKKVSDIGHHRAGIARALKAMQDVLSHDSFTGYREACAHGEKIVTDLDPSLYSAHAFLAYAYAIRWGEYGEDVERLAREHLGKAKAAGIEHSHILAAEAYLKFFSGDAAGAKAGLEPIVEDKTRHSSLLMGTLGIIELRSDELEKAGKHLKDANNFAPADARINAALAEVLRRQGNTFQAAKYYEDALRYEKDHVGAKLGIVQMAIDTGKWETAEKFVEQILATDPLPSPLQLAVAHMAKAIVFDGQGKPAEADKEAAVAAETDDRSPDLYILKAHLLARRKNVDGAIAAVRDAIKRDPIRSDYYSMLAEQLYEKTGGTLLGPLAVHSDDVNVAIDPPRMFVILGDAQRANNAFDDALTSYQRAIDAAKDHKLPDATLAIAETYKSKQDWTKAAENFEKCKDEFISSPRKQAYCLTELGKLYDVPLKDEVKALGLYKAAASTDPTYAPPFFLTAKRLGDDPKMMDRREVIELLERYLQLDPKGEYADEATRILKERKR